jgi:hypothetical protein
MNFEDDLTWIDDIPLVNTHIMKQLKAKLSWMITFMCLKCIKIMRIKPLSKICLEKHFERGRAGKGVC